MSTDCSTEDMNGSALDPVGFPPIKEEHEAMEITLDKSNGDVLEFTTNDGNHAMEPDPELDLEREEDDRIGEGIEFTRMADTLDRFAHFTIRKQTSYR